MKRNKEKGKRQIKRVLICMALALLCIGMTAVAGTLNKESVTNGNGGKTDVGMWYVTYNTKNHWTHFETKNPIMYQPLIQNPDGIVETGDEKYGTPNSDSTDEIDMHLQMLADAKVDFVLFDLTNGGLTEKVSYGWPTNTWIVETAKTTCERIANWNATHDWKIRYAVAIGCYDAICGIDNAGNQHYSHDDKVNASSTYCNIRGPIIEAQAQAVYEQFVTNASYGDAYYQVDGKPLLVIHNWGWDDTQAWKNYGGPRTYGDNFDVEGSSEHSANNGKGAGTFQWCVPDGKTQVSNKVETVMAGWHNGKTGNPDISRNNGEVYDNNCKTVLDNPLPRIVLITSFNDFHEQTAVMPTDTSQCATYEEKWQSNTLYWEKTKDFIQKIRAKNGESYAPEEVKISSIKGNKDANADLSADRLIDGKIEWPSFGVTIPDGSNLAWYEATLENPTKINRINLYLFNEAAKERPQNLAFDVYTSAGKWIRVAELHDIDWGIKEGGYEGTSDKNLLEINFKAVDAVAFRVIGNVYGVSGANLRALEVKAFYEKLYSSVYSPVEKTDDPNKRIPEVSPATIMSVTANDEYTPFPAYNLKDGVVNESTPAEQHAVTGYNADTNLAWYESMLETPTKLNQVKLFFYKWEAQRRPNNLAVDVLTKSGDWVRVAEQQNKDWNIQHNGSDDHPDYYSDINVLTMNFDVVEDAVAFRVTGKCTTKDHWNFRLVEVQGNYDAYLTPADKTGVPEISNIPLLSKASRAKITSVTANNTVADYAAERLRDGIVNVGCDIIYHAVAGYENNLAWYECKLSTATALNQVKIYFYRAVADERPKDLAVDVLKASGGWMRVAEIHNKDWKLQGNKISEINVLTMNFNVVSDAVAFRVTANGARTPEESFHNFRLVELEGYFDSNLTPYDYTGVNEPDEELYSIPRLPEGTVYVKLFEDISSYRGLNKTAPKAETGYLFAGWYEDEACTAAIAPERVDKSAYAKFVHEEVLTIKSQITAGTTSESPSSDIRFVTTVDGLSYNKVGFKVTCNGRTKEYSSDYVYKHLKALDANGTILEYQPEQEFSTCSQYFKACTITGIPNKHFSTDWEVTPFWVTEDGTRVDGRTSVTSVALGISKVTQP